MDCIKFTSRGAKSAAYAPVRIHDGNAAAEAAACLLLHHLFGVHKAIIVHAQRLFRVAANSMAGMSIKAAGLNYDIVFIKLCIAAQIAGNCQALTGMYEAMEQAKKEGKILHIGAAAHKISVAEEIVASGLYETLNFPFSYLASERDINLVKLCEEKGVGFIASKGLAGGLLTNAAACMAFMTQYNVLPVWGIQTPSELYEWLEFMDNVPSMTKEIEEIIASDKEELAGDFCRGCGNCMPCTANIQINQCARMMQIMRRTPKEIYSGEYWRKEMERVDRCIDCGMCKRKCPYELDVPSLLRKNLSEYREVIAGRKTIE